MKGHENGALSVLAATNRPAVSSCRTASYWSKGQKRATEGWRSIDMLKQLF
jgi:hypothetical protein